MSDNVEFLSGADSTPAASTFIATDEIGGAHYQITKLALGADGSASLLQMGQKTAASSLPVIIASDQSALPVSQSGTWNITSLTAGSVSVNNPAGASAVNVQDGGNSLTVDNAGTFATQASQAGTWSVAITNASSGSAVNIQDGGNSLTVDGTVAATQSGTWNIGTVTSLTGGSVIVNNPGSGSAVNIQDGGNSITVDGAVTVSGSISASGTFPVTQSGTWNVGTVTSLTAGSVSVNNPAGASAVNIQDGGNSITVDGTVSTTPTRPSTNTTASVVAASTNTTLLASNANRLGATVYNDSAVSLLLKLGATSSSTSYTLRMAASSYYEVPFFYTGIIDGLWTASSGAAMVGEMTA